MSVFISFMSVLAPVTYICVLFLRWFALEFIYNAPQDMWSGCPTTLLVTTALLAVATVIAKKMCSFFDRLIKKIKTENYVPTHEEIDRSLGCYKNLMHLTLYAVVFGFFIGQIILVYIGIKFNGVEFYPSRVFFIIAQACGFGGICAVSTINAMDNHLARFRRLLKIRSLEEYKKYKNINISTSIFISLFVIAYFFAINLFSVPYGAFFDMNYKTMTAAEGMNSYFIKGVECIIYCVLLSFYPAAVLIGGLSKRIRATAKRLEDIADKGDLTGRIDITMTDDFGMLTTSINLLISKLSSMIIEMKNGTSVVSETAAFISDSAANAATALENMSTSLERIDSNSQKQNELIYEADENISSLVENLETVKTNVLEQTNAIQNISSAITQMTANINSVAETAKKAQDVSDLLTNSSVNGNEAISKAVESMKDIEKSSDEVRKIIAVIQDIASKTNLLSMNAAIEAAHAGEYGKGFAVVAGEVFSLAASSAASASNIKKHIEEMLVKIKAGVDAISAAGSSFTEVNYSVKHNAEYIKIIFDAMEEQKLGANDTQKSAVEVLEAVERIKSLAEKETENAEGLREFMSTVVDAAHSTEIAVQESIEATTRLKDTIQKVDTSADGNKDSVLRIQEKVSQFTV
ncbi:MAG: hypothetical protein J6X54_08750 [Treponema sp.]|nr:hypothetical protein [Treponema sp.]